MSAPVHRTDARPGAIRAQEPVVTDTPCATCHYWRPAARGADYGGCQSRWAYAAGGGIETHRWSGCDEWVAVEDWA